MTTKKRTRHDVCAGAVPLADAGREEFCQRLSKDFARWGVVPLSRVRRAALDESQDLNAGWGG